MLLKLQVLRLLRMFRHAQKERKTFGVTWFMQLLARVEACVLGRPSSGNTKTRKHLKVFAGFVDLRILGW
ncbi:hypothetical protein A5774_07110 [Corynebacterium sp. EPI-003-04-2554_SCH2473622]|nr:hypothetical protein A5774_07110 [Corynebacterium sp. EPI-003-04-2554_SCH2473622]